MGLLQWMHRLVGGQKDLHLKRRIGNPATSHFIFISIFFLGYCAPDMRRCVIFMVLKTPALPLRCIHFNQFHFISYGAIGNGGFTHLLHTSSKGWRKLRMHELWMHALPTDYAEHKNLLQKSLSVQQSSAYAGQKGKKAINPEASLTLPLESKVLFIVKIPSCKP